MLEKLIQLEKEYQDIEKFLSSPDALNDKKKFADMSRRYKELEVAVSLAKRVREAEKSLADAEDVLKNDKDEVIAIFSHGNMIRYFLSKALKVDPKCMWKGVTLNCGSISVIQIKNGKMNVKLINGIDHLPHRDIKGFYSKHEDTTYLP